MAITQNSVLLRFLLALWTGLCTAARESGLYRFLRRGGTLDGWARDSVLCRALCRAGSVLAGWARGSALCRFFCREGVLMRAWPDSLCCRALSALVNLPASVLRWARPAAGGSALCRAVRGSQIGGLLGRLCAAPVFCLGLVIMAFLVVPHGVWNNLYGFLGAAAVLFFFYAGAAVRPRRRLELDRMGPYLALYAAMVCLSLVLSQDVSLSLRFFIFHVTALLLAVLTVSMVRRFEQLRLLAAMAMLGITAAALYGCWQVYAGTAVVGAHPNLTLNDGEIQRVFSFFDNPNNFAELLVMLVPLDFALIGTARTRRGRFCAAIALVPCLISLAFTYSRSSFIALVLAVVIFFALQDWRVVPLFLVLVLLAFPILPRSIYERVLSIADKDDTSVNYRFAIYEAVGEFLKDHWKRGVGLGSDVLQKVFKADYPPMYDGNYPIHAHSGYLQVWCEMGILGLLSFLGLLGGQLKGALRAFRRGTDPRVKMMLSGAAAAFCGILVISVAEYTWFYPRNMFIYFFLFGIIGACVKLAGAENAPHEG